MCDMTFAEAAEVLSRDDVSPRAREDAIEVALRALEEVEIQGQVILNLNRDMKAMRKAMNGQSEYAYLGGDLISREALRERIELINWYSTNDKGVLHSGATGDESAYVRYADVYAAVEDALAVEAEPVVHAHWIIEKRHSVSQNPYMDDNYHAHATCSHCGFVVDSRNASFGYLELKTTKLCPECGAHMDEEVAE